MSRASLPFSFSDRLPELGRIQEMASGAADPLVRVRELARVRTGKREFPIYAFVFGKDDPTLPTLGLFGGVHGLERVGTHVVLAELETLFSQLKWDHSLREILERVRIAAIPLVNPAGMFLRRRANANGVDLNRNAPVEASNPFFVLGGHRIGPWLPWYRGAENAPMETEAQALVDFVRAELFPSEFAMALDCHSGFGLHDRLWYPFARSNEAFPRMDEVRRLKGLLDRTYRYHVYRVEPQAANYTTHGDLWDHLFDLHRAEKPEAVFLPWTLEMGSWQWVRKNPKQLFSALGPYNPIQPHRYNRIMRRHLLLFDFLIKATLNHRNWSDE